MTQEQTQAVKVPHMDDVIDTGEQPHETPDKRTIARLKDEVAELKWTHDRPSVPGLYLRNNPATRHVVRHYIYEIDGVLKASGAESGGIGGGLLEDMHESFWWFGPIPEPPGPRFMSEMIGGGRP